jgi:hypothetical protein
MPDKDVFVEATRLEDWAHLAGDGASARAKSVGLRRARYAGFAGATAVTAAVAVGVVAIAATFGGSGSSAAVAGTPAEHTPAKVTVTSPPASPPTSAKSQAPAKGTMGALFEQWRNCPDSELVVVNSLPQDPPHLQQAWRDACHRDVATLSALLPGYDVTPAVATIVTPKESNPADGLSPHAFDDPEFVIPTGYVPHMGPAIYRIVTEDGDTTDVFIHALNRDDRTKPATGEAVTLPNGLRAWLTLGTNLSDGHPGYEIYILDKGHTFYMFTGPKPNFDFKALVTSPQFAEMAAQSLAEPGT